MHFTAIIGRFRGYFKTSKILRFAQNDVILRQPPKLPKRRSPLLHFTAIIGRFRGYFKTSKILRFAQNDVILRQSPKDLLGFEIASRHILKKIPVIVFCLVSCSSSRSEIDESLHNQTFEKFVRSNNLDTDRAAAHTQLKLALDAPGIQNILQSRKPTTDKTPPEDLFCPGASLVSFINRLHLQCWSLPDGQPRWVTLYAEGLAASDTFGNLFIQYRNHAEADPQTYFIEEAESYLDANGHALGATLSEGYGWLTLVATNPRAGFLIDVLIAKRAKLGIAKTLEANNLDDFGEALRKEAKSS